MASCLSLSGLLRARRFRRTARTWLLASGRANMGHIRCLCLAHSIRRPIFQSILGWSVHRVLPDRIRGFRLREPLPCKQGHAHEQAKKERANQRQLDTSLLLEHRASLPSKGVTRRTCVQIIATLLRFCVFPKAFLSNVAFLFSRIIAAISDL